MANSNSEAKVLVSHVIRTFIDAGGKLKYKPVVDGSGKLTWLVIGVRADGSELQVYIARSGEPKRFQSANAVLSYHMEMYPDCEEVCIPVLRTDRGKDNENSEEDG